MKIIEDYYMDYDEESRLIKDNSHRIEFITTIHHLNKSIKDKSKILEVGAGTGRYSFYYAEKSYDVTAIDIVPKNVNIMREKANNINNNINIHLGDARDLSEYEKESFDVVLCLGPLYHLTKLEERIKCIKECLRVLKKDGILAIAYINRYASYVVHVSRDKNYINDIGMKNIYTNGLEFGNENDCFYYSSYHGMEDLIKNFNVEKINQIGTDGIVNMMRDKINSLNEEEFKEWIKYHLMTCEDTSLTGYSLHGLYICKKK